MPGPACLPEGRPEGDRPWGTWSRGKAITAAAVARRLKNFHVIPNTIKLSDGKQPNGYKRSQFDDAFARYLPSRLVRSLEVPHPPQPQQIRWPPSNFKVPHGGQWGGFRTNAIPRESDKVIDNGTLCHMLRSTSPPGSDPLYRFGARYALALLARFQIYLRRTAGVSPVLPPLPIATQAGGMRKRSSNECSDLGSRASTQRLLFAAKTTTGKICARKKIGKFGPSA